MTCLTDQIHDALSLPGNFPVNESDAGEDQFDSDDEIDEGSSLEGDSSEVQDESLSEQDVSDDENLEEFQSSFKEATLNDSKAEFR